MPVVEDPAAVLDKQTPMYHLDDDNRYLMFMGVGPEGPDGNFTPFAPFQVRTFGDAPPLRRHSPTELRARRRALIITPFSPSLSHAHPFSLLRGADRV